MLKYFVHKHRVSFIIKPNYNDFFPFGGWSFILFEIYLFFVLLLI